MVAAVVGGSGGWHQRGGSSGGRHRRGGGGQQGHSGRRVRLVRGGAGERIRVGFPFSRAKPTFRGPNKIYAGQPKFRRAEWGLYMFASDYTML
jgi:hypothetical protein